ncbi:MAG TPA: molybdenum cofactor biosynthesis protein MoaE [Sorangium sp.]|nr:molybdenum cofactor biosynthesis protein MoaE [Sorangium sp.]
MSTTALTRDPITLQPWLEVVQQASAGAVVTFVGVVRNHNDGKPIARLEYHAYESMAAQELQRVADEVETENPGVALACAHRIGALSVGDTAVVCVVSAPHRENAFDACRMLIDRVKERVPIFKREHGPDGPYWIGWVSAAEAADLGVA